MARNNLKKYKKVVNDKTKDFGQTDFDKKLIEVNKTMNRRKGSRGELIDTIEHEFNHVRHPKMSEKKIQKLTEKTTSHMTRKSKEKAYKPFEKKYAKKGKK